ncbi:hypothetical protein [Fulvimonas yonginensis]|uniref:Uncharacterized protein n=1 Tax=Fulvimonas yonginensis TaxID=1495200 RepID=A0ABU8JCW2_9GAMM
MKTWLILAVLAAPTVAAATVAMEPAAAQTQSSAGSAPAHHQLFTVRYVLRPNPAPLPHVIIERDGGLMPPAGPAGRQALLLGTGYRDPNAILCYGWGCEGGRHPWPR